MSFSKRLRILYAALTQEWHQHVCKCGNTCWVQGSETWVDPSQCVICETRDFEDWKAKYEARQQQKGAA